MINNYLTQSLMCSQKKMLSLWKDQPLLFFKVKAVDDLFLYSKQSSRKKYSCHKLIPIHLKKKNTTFFQKKKKLN